jgi:hypothetical protein
VSDFSVRAVFGELEFVPGAVWGRTFLAALASQMLIVAIGIGVKSVAPELFAPVLYGLAISLTLVLPTIATARWQQPVVSMSTALRQALPSALTVGFGWVLLSTGYGLLPGSAPSGWFGLLLSGLVGGLALFLFLRASVWFNLLALPGAKGFSALRKSFELTGSVGFKIFLFWVLFTILIILLSFPVTMLLNALVGWQQNLAFLVFFLAIPLMSAIMAMIAAVAMAVIHRLLTEPHEQHVEKQP